MAGYSGTPLVKKLGIKAGVMHVAFEPEHYWDLVAPLPDGVFVKQKPGPASLDFAHLFVTERIVFEKEFVRLKKLLKKDAMLWVSWPKKSAKVATDLDENVVREYGLSRGLVDVKVCAVDDTWSGLKFVFRLKDR